MDTNKPPEPSPEQLAAWWAVVLQRIPYPSVSEYVPRLAGAEVARLAYAAGWEARGVVKDSLTAEAPAAGPFPWHQEIGRPPADEELLQTHDAAKRDHCYDGPLDDWPRREERAATVAGLRAVLARAAALLQQQAAELERLHSAAPVAWLYRGEPDYAGHPFGWRENWQATTSRQLAESASRPGMPIPLVPAHALPLPSGEVGG